MINRVLPLNHGGDLERRSVITDFHSNFERRDSNARNNCIILALQKIEV